MKSHQNPWSCLVAIALLSAFNLGLAKDEVREELHQTHSLTADGRFELSNVNGNIRITTWERNEVQIDAVKTARKQADLDAVKIEIEASKDRVQIKTRNPSGRKGENNSTSVEYTLRVPLQARLKKIDAVNGDILIENAQGEVEASSVNGRLTAKGLANEAKLATVNGRIEATVERLGKDQPISAETVNGPIVLTLPAGAAADVTAHSLNGSLRTDFDLTLVKHTPVGKDLSGKLGAGGTRVHASSVNGAIEIKKAD
jgi:DUF4097 and DUF4098 domain-containing protein YvlB